MPFLSRGPKLVVIDTKSMLMSRRVGTTKTHDDIHVTIEADTDRDSLLRLIETFRCDPVACFTQYREPNSPQAA